MIQAKAETGILDGTVGCNVPAAIGILLLGICRYGAAEDRGTGQDDFCEEVLLHK